MMNTDGYRGPQVCKIVGISYRQLDYWARTDLVQPSVAAAEGSGSQRLYSYHDLLTLKVVKSLLDSGLSLQAVRKAIKFVRERLGDDISKANLVIQGNTSLVADSGDQLIDILQQGQGVLNILPLGSMTSELDAKIVELGVEPGGGNEDATASEASG